MHVILKIGGPRCVTYFMDDPAPLMSRLPQLSSYLAVVC